jgi:ADP-heptose:LPS heptosyltransferase
MMLPAEFAPHRVLIVRPRGLGDVVLSSGVIDAVARAFPATEIDFMSEAASRPFLESDPRLSEVFLLGPPRPPGDAMRGGSTGAAIAWARARRADVLFDLFSNPRTALISGLSGVRWRVGFDNGVRRMAYNIRVPLLHRGPGDTARWAGEAQLDFVRDAGVRWSGEAERSVALRDDDVRFADASLSALGYAAGARPGAVLPGGSWPGKRWTVAGFAASVTALALGTGVPALVLWGPPEREEAESIVARAGEAARLAPATTLRQMAALIARLGLLVAPDCLGRHLAIVQNVPTVGYFAVTDPQAWTPPNGPHRVVNAGPASARAGREARIVEQVLAEIEAAVAGGFLDTPAGRS